MQRPQGCITLNVGGTRYTTTLGTLLSEESSYFTCLLSRDWNDAAQAEVFIDRDGEMFKYTLRFLRATQEGKASLADNLSGPDKVALLDEA